MGKRFTTKKAERKQIGRMKNRNTRDAMGHKGLFLMQMLPLCSPRSSLCALCVKSLLILSHSGHGDLYSEHSGHFPCAPRALSSVPSVRPCRYGQV
jgi:hypothetical protein